MWADPGRAPIYTVTGSDGATVTIDFTLDAGYQDLGFTLTAWPHSNQRVTPVRIHHTGEISLFCHILSAALLGTEPVIENIRHRLAHLTRDMQPTDRAEHRIEDALTQWRLAGRRPPELVAVYPGATPGEELRVAHRGRSFQLTVHQRHRDALIVDWPPERLDCLLTGMIWRTYRSPGELFSWLSRTPTAVYERIIDLAADTS